MAEYQGSDQAAGGEAYAEPPQDDERLGWAFRGYPRGVAPPDVGDRCAALEDVETPVTSATDETRRCDPSGEVTVTRDYALEGVDDAAGFDLTNDLKSWFLALLRIEESWDDPAALARVFREHGIRDERHFYQVQATVGRFCRSTYARGHYGDEGDIAQLKADAASEWQSTTQRLPIVVVAPSRRGAR